MLEEVIRSHAQQRFTNSNIIHFNPGRHPCCPDVFGNLHLRCAGKRLLQCDCGCGIHVSKDFWIYRSVEQT